MDIHPGVLLILELWRLTLKPWRINLYPRRLTLKPWTYVGTLCCN
jgi:hypothetical protein